MGGGKEKRKTNQLIDEQRRQQQAEHEEARQSGQKDIAQSAGQQSESRSGVLSSLDYSPSSISAERLGSFSPIQARSVTARTVSPNLDFSQGRQRYQNFIDTGGVDVGAMRTGQDKFGGAGVFEEFAKTGGLDEPTRANIRQRATSVIPAFYQRLRDESDRLGNVQGGYGPGRLALASRLARGEAAGAQDAALNAELGIQQQILAGRRFGAEGVQRQGQLLNASEQAAQQALQRGKMFGTEGWAGSEQEEQQGRLEAEMFNARQQAAAEALNAQLGTQADTFNTETGMRAGMFNAENALSAARSNQSAQDAAAGRRTSALTSLYGSDVNAGQAARDRLLQDRNITYGAGSDLLDLRNRTNPQRDWFGTIMGGVGAAAGAATGLGALGFGRKRAA